MNEMKENITQSTNNHNTIHCTRNQTTLKHTDLRHLSTALNIYNKFHSQIPTDSLRNCFYMIQTLPNILGLHIDVRSSQNSQEAD